MPAEKTFKKLDDIPLIKRRFELMTVAEYRDKDKIRKASESIDEIRKAIGSKGKSATEIVREWRKNRYGSSGS